MEKTIKLTLLVLAILTGTLLVAADGGTATQNPTNPKVVVLLPPKQLPNRPKVPSKQQVNVLYIDQYLYMDFAIPEGICEMSLVNLTTGENVYASFDSENPEPIYVGELSTATITVTTETGHVYQGEW